MYGRRKKLNKSKTQKQSEENITSSIRNLFILKKRKEEKKLRIVRDIRKLFEQLDDDYCTPEKVSNFWNNNYIEHQSNGDRNKNLSLEVYFTKLYLT